MRFILLLGFTICASIATAQPLDLKFRLSLENFAREQSDIDGLVGMSILAQTQSGLYVGESIYSGALGSGGGFFVGGVELGYTQSFGSIFWDAGLFVGGGGGAAQVPGDGLMLRPQIHAGYVGPEYRLGFGASWVSVSGSAISTPSFGLTYTQDFGLALSAGTTETRSTGVTITAIKPLARVYYPQNNRKRDGSVLEPMYMLGAEVTFSDRAGTESFIQASGLVAGNAEGYADWILGMRWYRDAEPFRLFIDIGGGSAGGGGVETGGGLVVAGNLGASYQISETMAAEASLGAIRSLNGDFLVFSPALKLRFDFAKGSQQRWQVSTGLTQQFPNAEFYKTGVTHNGQPLMIHTSMDVFIGKSTYLTGHAYTAIAGNTGGYQIGFIGLGYGVPLSDRIGLSGEVLIGAGGGAGVDTQGGLLAGAEIALDYRISDRLYATLGLGQIVTVSGGGMAPPTLSLGIKIPLMSYH